MINRIFNTEQYLGHKRKNYFEGWYFRAAGDTPFAFIIGVSKSIKDPHSFIQYIDSSCSYYFRYDLNKFSFIKDNMTINIDNNIFSLQEIRVNASQDGNSVSAELKLLGITKLNKSLYAPSVMGPFAYLPMFCRHSIVSLQHIVEGDLRVNNKVYKINGIGYIEKDYGTKFPSNYLWLHSSTKDTVILLAIAWPLIFGIKGLLCIILHKGQQYNFSLYNGGKIELMQTTLDNTELIIKCCKSQLKINVKNNLYAQKLLAPASNANMNIVINENLKAEIKCSLILNGLEIDTSDITCCAYEQVVI